MHTNIINHFFGAWMTTQITSASFGDFRLPFSLYMAPKIRRPRHDLNILNRNTYQCWRTTHISMNFKEDQYLTQTGRGKWPKTLKNNKLKQASVGAFWSYKSADMHMLFDIEWCLNNSFNQSSKYMYVKSLSKPVVIGSMFRYCEYVRSLVFTS